jgi:type I restriction-modification system DNA methylase subunit
MNERKTENIVRELLRRNSYYDSNDIVIEEQRSDNPKITKLLRNASKRGNGCGYPEFIISSKSNSNFIIVIECKAELSKHQSKNLDKYADYAVDGALLYASFLSKEYDVLAIAVSGENQNRIQVSHFLRLKETGEHHQYFADKILPFDEYIDGIIHSNYKFNQDYGKLIAYTKTLNELLHGKKIKESQRALLISGILIALKNDAFKSGYNKHKSTKSLVENLYGTICSEIAQSDIKADIAERLKLAFSFIKTGTSLTSEKDGKAFVESLIADIDAEINGFMQTHKYVDTVSQFYVEFLRYANDDKGLGIVLTPSHITDLFADLADVNKDSVVFDNCCGTGGFLISAMKRMIKDAKGDRAKENKIKKNQLVGIEYQDDIYALLVSNMILHRDGRTNIFLGDCFDKSFEVGKKFKPNVGLLNPPYKTKKSDIEELEFVLNNLEILEPGGKCVAIIPLSCVIEDTTIARTLKKRVLSKHTVEAVMSLPEELFHNSDVNVVTCAIVITAHKPHPQRKKTWFGYWRKDGFVKVKNKGRIDKNNTWGSIKEKWVSAFKNRDIVDDLSLAREITEEDEWCAEAYMVTDYSKISREDYETTVKKYILFNLMDLTGFTVEEGIENDSR